MIQKISNKKNPGIEAPTPTPPPLLFVTGDKWGGLQARIQGARGHVPP